MLTQMKDEEKIRIIELRVLNELGKYFEAFKTGMPMKVVAIKYGRYQFSGGGIPEILVAMQKKGLLYVTSTAKGVRTVFPGRMPHTVVGDASEYF